MAMASYKEAKEAVRRAAFKWKAEIADRPMSYEEIGLWYAYWHKVGRRYGLLSEFHKNGIC